MKPGKDIIVVSIDGVKGAFEAMVAGKLNCTVECNPLLGPAADGRGQGPDGRQAAAEAHRDRGERLPEEVAAKEFPKRKY